MSYKDGVFVADNTELDCYRRCPRYYFYRIMEGMTGTDSAKALEFGIAVHLAIETVMKGGNMVDAIALAVEYFAPFDDGSDKKRTVGTLRHILGEYFLYYADDPFKADEVEVGFAIDLAPGVLYTGRVDVHGHNRGYSGRWGMDNKTAWRVDDYQMKPHNQFTGYIYALKEYFEGVEGLVGNLILVAADACTLRKDGTGYLKGKAPEDCFFRTTTTRTADELAEWRSSTLGWIDQIRRSIDANHWPQNTTFGCKAFNKQCEYYPVCIQPDPEQQRELLHSPLYKYNPWEPYPDGKEDEKGDAQAEASPKQEAVPTLITIETF